MGSGPIERLRKRQTIASRNLKCIAKKSSAKRSLKSNVLTADKLVHFLLIRNKNLNDKTLPGATSSNDGVHIDGPNDDSADFLRLDDDSAADILQLCDKSIDLNHFNDPVCTGSNISIISAITYLNKWRRRFICSDRGFKNLLRFLKLSTPSSQLPIDLRRYRNIINELSIITNVNSTENSIVYNIVTQIKAIVIKFYPQLLKNFDFLKNYRYLDFVGSKWHDNVAELQNDVLSISLNIFTDGAPYSKSVRNSIYPLVITIKELPAKISYSLQGTVWGGISVEKPDWNLYIKGVLDQITDSLHTVIVGSKVVKFKIFLLSISADSIERAQVLHMKRPIAYFGCPFCQIKGTPTQNLPIFDTQDSLTAICRTHADFVNPDINMGFMSPNPTVLTMFCVLPRDILIDPMHSCYAYFKKLFESIYSTRTRIQFFDNEVSLVLVKIKWPYEIRRKIKPLAQYKLYKSFEWKILLLYLIPTEVFTRVRHLGLAETNMAINLLFFSSALFLLQCEKLTPEMVDYAHKLLIYFHYGLKTSFKTSLAHLNLHIASKILVHGSPNQNSNYYGESVMGILVRKVRCANFAKKQIDEMIKGTSMLTESELLFKELDTRENITNRQFEPITNYPPLFHDFLSAQFGNLCLTLSSGMVVKERFIRSRSLSKTKSVADSGVYFESSNSNGIRPAIVEFFVQREKEVFALCKLMPSIFDSDPNNSDAISDLSKQICEWIDNAIIKQKFSNALIFPDCYISKKHYLECDHLLVLIPFSKLVKKALVLVTDDLCYFYPLNHFEHN